MLLKNKICLVSGAGKGLGKAILDSFLNEGAFVYAIDKVLGSLDAYKDNSSVRIMYFDVSEENEDKKVISLIKKEKGCLDVLVNNAGVMHDSYIGTITSDLINNIYSTNVFGSIYLLQLAAKVMIPKKSGSIINVTSIVGITGNPGQLVYSSSKGAIISMTKTAAKELGVRGIRVNAISPGMIETDMLRMVDEKYLNIHLSHIPSRHFGKPQDIADACVFLASDKSQYINGHILQVDGGIIV